MATKGTAVCLFFYFFFLFASSVPKVFHDSLLTYFYNKKLFLMHVFFLDMTYKRCNTVIPNKPQ